MQMLIQNLATLNQRRLNLFVGTNLSSTFFGDKN